VRIRGPAVNKERLNVDVDSDDIEAAHLLPTRPDLSNSADAAQRPPAQMGQRGLPVITVRFWQRKLRDIILRKRR